MCIRIPLTQPNITPIPGDKYLLVDIYRVSCDLSGDGSHHRITVYKGFEYDGASVPRLLWTLSGLRPDGLLRAAALIHDLIYVRKGRLRPSDASLCLSGVWTVNLSVKVSRKRADRLFYDMMIEAGMKKGKARMAYFAVRAAGWVLWIRKPKPRG